MNDGEILMIPYVAHEADMAREDRKHKSLVFALVLAILVAFASNAIWLYCWMQYDYEDNSYTATQDGNGTNVFSGGDMIYGTADYSAEADAH